MSLQSIFREAWLKEALERITRPGALTPSALEIAAIEGGEAGEWPVKVTTEMYDIACRIAQDMSRDLKVREALLRTSFRR